MSFRTGTIGGTPYILANSGNGILTQPASGGLWQRIASPGGIAPNAHLSLVETDGVTEVVTCIGGWGGGSLYYARIDTPSNATWTGPITTANQTFTSWDFFPGESAIWARCKTPTSCDPDITVLGKFPTLEGCQEAVNKTAALDGSAVAWCVLRSRLLHRVASGPTIHETLSVGVHTRHTPTPTVASRYQTETHRQIHALIARFCSTILRP